MTPDLTCGERHILQFISDEWQPASAISAFANRDISRVNVLLKRLIEKGMVEKMWDGYLGVHYWRLRRDPGFHRASEEAEKGVRDMINESICKICESGQQKPFCIGCSRLREHDMEVAQAAREDERKKIIRQLESTSEYIKTRYSDGFQGPEMKSLGKIRAETYDGIIESLRSAIPAPEPEKDGA